MAYQLAQAYVQIVPSMKGVGKAIESAFDGPSKSVGQKAGDTAGGGFSRGFSAKLGVISGVASSIATKVIGVFSGLSGQILDASNSTQKFAQTLDFAGVGADQIKKLTTSTQEYANKTVYGIDDIRNTTAQLAANGVPNYDKLAEAAGNLNAVAGGNSETFKSVAMMLTQTAGAGKLTTENWNQLGRRDPRRFGQAPGGDAQERRVHGNFRDAMANGEITSQEFNDALMQLGMNDGAIKAAESTQTFEGAFGNLEATIVDGAANIVNTVKPYITGAVTALGDGIGKAMQWVNDFTGALMKTEGVQTFANGVKSIAGAVGSIVGRSPASSAACSASPAARTVPAGPPSSSPIFWAASAACSSRSARSSSRTPTGCRRSRSRSWRDMARSSCSRSSRPWSASSRRSASLTPLPPQSSGLLNAAMNANPISWSSPRYRRWSPHWSGSSRRLRRSQGVGGVHVVRLLCMAKTVDAVTSLGQNIANFFTQTLPNAFQSVVQWFQRLPERIGSALSNLLTAVGEWATCLAQSAWTAGNQFVQNVVYFITHLPETIAYWLSYSITFVVAWVALMGQKAIDAGTQFVQNAGTFISQLPGNIWNWLVATVTNTANWVAQMAGKASEAGSQFLNNMATFISQLPGRIWAFLVNVLTGAANWAGQMASNAAPGRQQFHTECDSVHVSAARTHRRLPARRDIERRGLRRSDGAGALNAGRQFLSNIVNTLASIPGRVVSIGHNIVEGIVSGIMGSIGRIGNAILGGVNDAIANVKRMLGIHSPSRLFRDQIGMMMGLGLANGIDASARYVNASMGSMIGGLMPDINDLLPANRTYDAATMNRRMVYTPSTDAMQPQCGCSDVNITNYYPQADPWPLATNDSLDKLTVGI